MSNSFETPDQVEFKGKVKGVSALSKKAKAMFVVGAFMLMCFILFAIFTVGDSQEAAAPNSEQAEKEAAVKSASNEPARGDAIFKGVGDGNSAVGSPVPAFDLNMPSASAGSPAPAPAASAGAVPAFGLPAPSADAPQVGNGVPALAQPGKAPPVVLTNGSSSPQPVPALSPKQIAEQELLAMREAQRKQAMSARMEVDGVDPNGSRGSGAPNPTAALASLLSGAGGLGGATGSVPGMPQFGSQRPQEQDDQNKQMRKEGFLRDAETKSSEFYLKEKKQAAKSPYELKMGWKIPAFLIDGINSDLPGQTCAMVRENVYDSISGKHLLIPQGTKVCGTYDSQVAVGQERLLMVWNRLIFEDGTSLNLAGMPGVDQAGYAGFDAEVDNHYVRLFAGSVMMSVVSAGVQLSQPRQSTNSNAPPSVGQTAAAALGQQLGQVSTAIAQRDLRIQPTLRQAPGYRFNVQVTRDIVFPGPWKRSPPGAM